MELELLDSPPDLAFQTDRLPELREYIKTEGMLLKGEALELVETLYVARKLLRDADESGCARVHLKDWQKNIEPIVRVCNEEPVYDMKPDRARDVLSAASSVLSAMLGQMLTEQRATA